MKYNPCVIPSCGRNAIPTSKRGFCARCQEIVKVIDYLVAQEREAAKPRISGLITPDDIKAGRVVR